jgi:hypothetical protein
MHPTRRELYIAVPGKNHILKVDVDSGEFARTAREEYPIYSNKLPSFEYSIWECVTQDVFASNINQPTGMVFSLDYERLFVAERGTGNIIVYEVNTGDLLYTISTQFNTIGGMDISPNGNELYFVDDETNTLNVVSVVTECDITYTPRTNPEYISELEKAKVALGVNDPFKLSPNTICTVDPIVPNITFFDQVHLDGYASDDPNVQSVMAGMDAAAALLKNRTDCDYDSELNFDALLLGGYFCHTCLPNQDQICGGGGSCTNIQWEGYICDNEFQIVDNNNINTELPGTYRIQTMNGTDVDPSTLVLKPGITYRFQIDVDEEVCLSTTVLPFDRDSVKLGLSSGGVGSGSSESRNRERNSLGTNNEESLKEYVTLGCATRSGGPLFFNAGRDEITGPQIYVNTGAGTRAMILDGGVESSGHLLPGAISGLVLVVLVGLLI